MKMKIRISEILENFVPQHVTVSDAGMSMCKSSLDALVFSLMIDYYAGYISVT